MDGWMSDIAAPEKGGGGGTQRVSSYIQAVNPEDACARDS